MNEWRDRLQRLAGDIGGELQRVGAWALLGSDRLHEIDPYRGYGNAKRILVHGRALRNRNLAPSAERDSAWRNLLNTYRRVDSDGLSHARIRASVAGVEREIEADEEGFFRAWIDLPAPPPNEPWLGVDLKLLSPLRADQPDVRAKARVRIPTASNAFGVISDLDDTVIQSRVA